MNFLRGVRPGRFLAALALQIILLIFLYTQVRPLVAGAELPLLNRAFFFAGLLAFGLAVLLAWHPVPEPDFTPRSAPAIDPDLERAQWQAVLENVESGLVIVDAFGTVQLTNQRLQQLFALSPDESLAGTLAHLIRHYQFVELWRRSVELSAPQTITAEVPQSKRILRASVFPLRAPLAGHALLLFEDVTELRRLETVRKDFVSNVSHELRTPLTSLKALTESLRAGALEEPEMARRFLGHIETEVDALTELVSELLELARTESKEVQLRLESVDPCSLLAAAAGRLRLPAERAGLTLASECPPGLPLVQADPPRIEQVLVNLIHNAIKFTPSGGSILVSAAQKAGSVEFSILDTGIGIAPEDQQRIFERFYKTDPSRNRSGTGLGLAIARHVVEAHGGLISVESREGQGSRFFFTLSSASAS